MADEAKIINTTIGKIDKNPGVLPGDTMSEAGKKVWRYQLDTMIAQEEGTRLGQDIEALHDMRVSTRRMRAAFEVFNQSFSVKELKPHLKGLRATGRVLGSVRDLDVFMEKAETYLSSLPEEDRHDLDPLLNSWRSQREVAREIMLDYLNSKRYDRFKTHFSSFLEMPESPSGLKPGDFPKPVQVRHLAPILIYTHLASVRAFDAILNNASIPQLHALRIQFKKFRYTIEFFREVLTSEADLVINDIKVIQDHLGNLNDTVVAAQLLEDFLKAWRKAQDKLPLQNRQSSTGIMKYLSSRYTEQHLLVTSFSEVWIWFNRPEFQKNMALALTGL